MFFYVIEIKARPEIARKGNFPIVCAFCVCARALPVILYFKYNYLS